MEIWKPDEKSREIEKGTLDVIGETSLPYLDTEMSYDWSIQLSFKVYSKPGSNMKYGKRGSMHTSMCLNAIQQGVSIRLASLTSRMPEKEMKRLSKINPDMDKALQVAELIKEGKELPILGQLLDN